MTTSATPKQIAYIRSLMRDAGLDSHADYLGSWAKPYLSQRERNGRLETMDRRTASKLIDGLKGR